MSVYVSYKDPAGNGMVKKQLGRSEKTKDDLADEIVSKACTLCDNWRKQNYLPHYYDLKNLSEAVDEYRGRK